MPELPEVETIARRLSDGGDSRNPGLSLIGKTIERAYVLWDRTVATPSVPEFLERIAGQQIREIGRRGKYLLLRLEPDWLLFHLRMSGDLSVGSRAEPFAPHDRLVLDLEGAVRLRFNDPRKFGRAWLVGDPAIVLSGLGPEPLDPTLTPEIFYRSLASHRRKVKALLLDQEFLAGVGNIYADEALFLAHIHPLTPASDLDLDRAGRLLQSIQSVLEEGIKRNGASIDWVYRGGEFQEHFQVYQRAGRLCSRCGSEIQRIVVSQRGTHFCPNCQPYNPAVT